MQRGQAWLHNLRNRLRSKLVSTSASQSKDLCSARQIELWTSNINMVPSPASLDHKVKSLHPHPYQTPAVVRTLAQKPPIQTQTLSTINMVLPSISTGLRLLEESPSFGAGSPMILPGTDLGVKGVPVSIAPLSHGQNRNADLDRWPVYSAPPVRRRVKRSGSFQARSAATAELHAVKVEDYLQ
jgi:hypothetical protein